ncbi:MAG: DinB family protein [Actinomycetota bacterium]|nr:DinB family protein [Actinomycetota bacterium]
MTRTDDPSAPDERSTLLSMLEYVQQTALFKVNGLSEELARRAPIATSALTNPASLLNHLRWNEYHWIEVVVLGGEDVAPWSEDNPDGEMEEGLTLPWAGVIAAYEKQIGRNRDLIARLDLDALAAKPLSSFRPNVRWVVLHLIEETSRHNGHLDLLREMADGSVGD